MQVLSSEFSNPALRGQDWVVEARSSDGRWAGTGPMRMEAGLAEHPVPIRMRRTGSLRGYVMRIKPHRWPGSKVVLIEPMDEPGGAGVFAGLAAFGNPDSPWGLRDFAADEQEDRRRRAVLLSAKPRWKDLGAYRIASPVAVSNQYGVWELNDIVPGRYLLLAMAGSFRQVQQVEVREGRKDHVDVLLPQLPEYFNGEILVDVEFKGSVPVETVMVLLTAELPSDPAGRWDCRRTAVAYRMLKCKPSEEGHTFRVPFTGLPRGLYRIELVHETAFPWNTTRYEVIPSDKPIQFTCDNTGPWEQIEVATSCAPGTGRSSRPQFRPWMRIEGGSLPHPIHRANNQGNRLRAVLPAGTDFRIRVGSPGCHEVRLRRADFEEAKDRQWKASVELQPVD